MTTATEEKKVLTHGEVMEKLQPLMQEQVKHILDGSRASVTIRPDMISLRPGKGARVMEITPNGLGQIAHFVQLPANIGDQLRAKTLENVMSEMLSRRNKFSVVLNKENQVVDLIRYKERDPINAERVLTTIEKAIPVQGYNRVLINGRNVQLEVTGELEQAVQRGDLVRAGVMVQFSPMGVAIPRVQSYATRLECTNGAVSNHFFSDFNFGGGGSEGDDIWQWFRQSARKAYRSFESFIGEWRKLTEENIRPEDRAAILESLLKRCKITGEDARAVHAYALERPPQNAWDMFNVLTWASSHLLTDPRQVHQAQTLASDFASETSHSLVCPVCRRARGTPRALPAPPVAPVSTN